MLGRSHMRTRVPPGSSTCVATRGRRTCACVNSAWHQCLFKKTAAALMQCCLICSYTWSWVLSSESWSCTCLCYLYWPSSVWSPLSSPIRNKLALTMLNHYLPDFPLPTSACLPTILCLLYYIPYYPCWPGLFHPAPSCSWSCTCQCLGSLTQICTHCLQLLLTVHLYSSVPATADLTGTPILLRSRSHCCNSSDPRARAVRTVSFYCQPLIWGMWQKYLSGHWQCSPPISHNLCRLRDINHIEV